jgi:phage tail-like protein
MAGTKPAKNGNGGSSGRSDPDIPFSFFVEIDGIQCVKFREVRGLEWQAEPVQFYEGGNFRHKVSLIGQGSFTPLVLKKGFFGASGEFFDWLNALMNPGKDPIKRATISVVIRSDAGEETGRFNLFGAFMTRYAGPGFNAMENAVAFEEVEIVYDYFEYEPGEGGGALQSGRASGKGPRG